MKNQTALNPCYALLGADRNSSRSDLRHFRNKRLLELNHPEQTMDWHEIDQRTRHIQQAYWLLTQKTG